MRTAGGPGRGPEAARSPPAARSPGRPEARGMAAEGAAQVPVAFEDVAVYFSPEEWAELAKWQRELYRAVMKENYELVASLGEAPFPLFFLLRGDGTESGDVSAGRCSAGHPGVKPEIICQLERGEEPCVGDSWGWKEGRRPQDLCSAPQACASAFSVRIMDPALLFSIVLSIMNTTRLILQYFQSCEEYDDSLQAALLCSMERNNSRLLLAFTEQLHTVDRRFWTRETSSDWWDRIVMQVWDDEQWLQNFRMRKATFLELCAELAPVLRCSDTKMRVALTVEKRVAIAVWKLATPDCYRSVGNQFGVGKSTVGVAVMQVCRAINRVLLRRTVTLGNVREIVDGFAAMGFPNCGGAIDATHIPILAPDHLATEYINRMGYFSMVLQALVDYQGRFTDINAGWSGKVRDAQIFRNTGLYRKLQAGTFFPDQRITIGDVEMPIVILGDPAYPLLPWLMKPYAGHLDRRKEHFNNRLSRCRMTVECAFGRLKGRWRCLLTRLNLSEDNIPMVIAACCVLHNICEAKGEKFPQGWSAEVDRLSADFEQPHTTAIRRAHRGAMQLREALKDHFNNEPQ